MTGYATLQRAEKVLAAELEGPQETREEAYAGPADNDRESARAADRYEQWLSPW
jgi:hypothetical protein